MAIKLLSVFFKFAIQLEKEVNRNYYGNLIVLNICFGILCNFSFCQDFKLNKELAYPTKLAILKI